MPFEDAIWIPLLVLAGLWTVTFSAAGLTSVNNTPVQSGLHRNMWRCLVLAVPVLGTAAWLAVCHARLLRDGTGVAGQRLPETGRAARDQPE
jgi:hypothetical protein